MQNISKAEFIKSEFKKIQNLFIKGKYNLVIEKSKKMIKKDFTQIPFYNLIALSYREMGQFSLAEEFLIKAIKMKPNDQSVLNNLGTTYRAKGEYIESEKFLKLALKNKPGDINALCNYANLKRDTNEFEESIKYYEEAFSINNKISTIVINLAGAYQVVGRFEDSKKCLEDFLKDFPNNVIAHKLLSSVTNYKLDNYHQKDMLLTLKEISLNDLDLSTLNFAIAKSYEDQKNYGKSYEFFKKANNIQRKRDKEYSINQEIKYFDKIKKIFKNINIANYANSENREKNLFFIVGLPRSGTTLTHQILASHSKVYGAGELPHFYNFIQKNIDNNDFISLFEDSLNAKKIKDIGDLYISKLNFLKTSKKIILDKTPANFVGIGFIKTLFPNAKIIHCNRNLKDTAISIYRNSFDDSIKWGNNEDDLVKYISIYLDLMLFWKKKIPNFIYNIDYEQLIQNQEDETKKLLKFCNLNWEENCLKFNKLSTPIKTVSITQARKSVYKTSLNSYKKYEPYLKMFQKIDDLKI